CPLIGSSWKDRASQPSGAPPAFSPCARCARPTTRPRGRRRAGSSPRRGAATPGAGRTSPSWTRGGPPCSPGSAACPTVAAASSTGKRARTRRRWRRRSPARPAARRFGGSRRAAGRSD
ncbi:MAG: hypothetical protein AVDCRST_MAG39-606, partial [uncultured Sphingomonadaceae bacterium]